MKKYDVIIIGGGASGLFAGSLLCEAGLSVMISEPNRQFGRKLRITGKGRCNLTNNCSAQEVMKNTVRNPKFLYSALSKFPPSEIMSWFEERGVPLKTERGRRVFPVSDNANDIADVMANICIKNGAKVLHSKASGLICDGGEVRGVKFGDTEACAGAVILAAGGMSYPKTGSDGSGYKIAESVGHSVTRPEPSLVPIIVDGDFCATVAGLTLKNVTLKLIDTSKPKKPVYSELGELTFFSFGIGGPLGISASCVIDSYKLKCKGYELVIDLKPGLSAEQLDRRILRDIQAAPSENIESLMRGLLPKEFAESFIERFGLDGSSPAGNITKESRAMIVEKLKAFTLVPVGLRPFDEAIITRGGIKVGEITPSTMESKLVKNLYFTGEIIDCDCFTGGYNLTEAFATAFCAAEDIINKKGC